MSVSVIVPVWNDEKGVSKLIDALSAVTSVKELIFIDDHSDQILSSQVDTKILEENGKEVVFIRHSENLGAGAARNVGIQKARYPFIMFLDSDDLPTENFESLIESFINSEFEFDFGMFRHLDTRTLKEGELGGLKVDEDCWAQLPSRETPAPMTDIQIPLMASVSAYPWNKIYRTDFLREKKIKCTEIPIHNDIELHWASFLKARRILYSNVAGVIHHVEETGKRITNRTDKDRLRVFEALQETVEQTSAQTRNPEMIISFWQFYAKLMRWIPQNIAPDHTAELHARNQSFILQNLTPTIFSLIAFSNLALSLELLKNCKMKATQCTYLS